MPVRGQQERQRMQQQLGLFEARIPLPRWRDLDPGIRKEVVATLAAVLREHGGPGRATGEAHDEEVHDE
jgi:hypothetical protein